MQLATRLVSTRRGTLIAALLIALLAGASILLYLNSYRDSLKAQGAMVTVLVAKKSIPKGTAGNVVAAKDLYTVTTIRESQLLDGALSDPASIPSISPCAESSGTEITRSLSVSWAASESPAAPKSVAVNCAPSKISRAATLSRSEAGSLSAPSSSWLSRIVVTV